jgi:hypothetical protein
MDKKSKPIVLLPYCVKNLPRLEEMARKEGFDVRVVKYDDEIPAILKEYQPSYVLGIACAPKVKKVGAYLQSVGQEYEAVPLSCEQCFKATGKPAEVDESKYQEALKNTKSREGRKNLGKIVTSILGILFLGFYPILSKINITGNVILENSIKVSPLIAGLFLILIAMFYLIKKKKSFYILK